MSLNFGYRWVPGTGKIFTYAESLVGIMIRSQTNNLSPWFRLSNINLMLKSKLFELYYWNVTQPVRSLKVIEQRSKHSFSTPVVKNLRKQSLTQNRKWQKDFF